MDNVDVLPNRVYRHFKGGYYLVLSVANNEDTFDFTGGEDTVVYQSLNDGAVWTRPYLDFVSLVPDGKPNPTCQRHRFELVDSISSPALNTVPTSMLIEELRKRTDCPFAEMGVKEFADSVAKTEYALMRETYDNRCGGTVSAKTNIIPIFVEDTISDVLGDIKRNPNSVSSRDFIVKRVCINLNNPEF